MTTLCAVLMGILLWGVGTLWVRERWACGSLEAAIFLCTAWLLMRIVLRGRGATAALLPGVLLAMGFWGMVQLAAGWSVAPADTADAILYWAAAGCLAWLGMEACAERESRRQFLKALLLAGTTVCVLGLIQLFTSTGRVFWVFASGYDSEVIGSLFRAIILRLSWNCCCPWRWRCVSGSENMAGCS